MAQTIFTVITAALIGAINAHYVLGPALKNYSHWLLLPLKCSKCSSFWTYQLLLAGMYFYNGSPHTLPLVLAGFAAAFLGEGIGDLDSKYHQWKDMREINRLKAARRKIQIPK